jgi:hypothetical protein
MKNSDAADASDPGLRIWVGTVLILGEQWRGSTPINPGDPDPAGDTLVSVFDPTGPDPSVVRSAVSDVAGFVRELISKAPPRTKRALITWIDRHRAELVAAADSLCTAYARDIERVRRAGPREMQIDGLRFVPRCAFESIFISWIFEARPAVLLGAIDLMTGVLFALPSEQHFHEATGELMKDLRTLNDVASRLSAHIERLRLPGPFQGIAEKADAFGLKRFEDSLRSVRSFLAPIMSELKAKGRRSDPLRSVVVRCFRAAGLTDGDIAEVLDVKKDAVRKQARKTAPKGTTGSRKTKTRPRARKP